MHENRAENHPGLWVGKQWFDDMIWIKRIDFGRWFGRQTLDPMQRPTDD